MRDHLSDSAGLSHAAAPPTRYDTDTVAPTDSASAVRHNDTVNLTAAATSVCPSVGLSV